MDSALITMFLDSNMTREEAIKIIKEFISGTCLHLVDQEALKTLIPELRENDDESIREDLIDGLMWQRDNLETIGPHDNNNILPGFCFPVSEHLAYLERQKYDRMKPIYDARESFESALEKAWNDYHNGYENVDKLEDDYVESAHAKGFREGYLFGVEKQKEQKPAEWSEGDKKLIDGVINSLCCYQNTLSDYQKEIVGEEIRKLKSLKPQPKQEWSDEDEGELQNAIDALEFLGKKGMYKSESGYDAALQAASWLKLFRLPFKDKEMKLKILKYLSTRCSSLEFEEVEDYLNNLRLSWKPSEEQMEALKEALETYNGFEEYDAMKSLYNDLKKL